MASKRNVGRRGRALNEVALALSGADGQDRRAIDVQPPPAGAQHVRLAPTQVKGAGAGLQAHDPAAVGRMNESKCSKWIDAAMGDGVA